MLLLSAAILLSKQLVLIFVIGLFYSVSHYVLQLDSIKTVPLRRSLVDNLSHIIIGIFSWLLSISYEKLYHPWNIVNCLLCGFFASIVDIDHFLMARSLKLNVSIIFLEGVLFSHNFPTFHYDNWYLLAKCLMSGASLRG